MNPLSVYLWLRGSMPRHMPSHAEAYASACLGMLPGCLALSEVDATGCIESQKPGQTTVSDFKCNIDFALSTDSGEFIDTFGLLWVYYVFYGCV